MRAKYVQTYRLDNHKVIPYDGRYKNLVSRYDWQLKNKPNQKPEIVEIIGSLHKAKKFLGGTCLSCIKPINKDDWYVQRNWMIFFDAFRSHLECVLGDHSEEICYFIKSVKREGYQVIHEVIGLKLDSYKESLNDRTPKV